MFSLQVFPGEERIESPRMRYLCCLTYGPKAEWLRMTLAVYDLSVCVSGLGERESVPLVRLQSLDGCGRDHLEGSSLMSLVLGWETGMAGAPDISHCLCLRVAPPARWLQAAELQKCVS